MRGPRRGQSWGAFLRATDEDLKTAGARAGLQLAFMANEASERLHAIAITLVRLVVTRRRLLEWETAAASAARSGPVQWRAFLRGMAASPLLAMRDAADRGARAAGGAARSPSRCSRCG